MLVVRLYRMIFETPEFEWDEAKSQKNLADRGFGFDYASRIFEDEVFVIEDNRREYGETRVIAVGKIGEIFLAVVFTWREKKIRIISARIAKRRERNVYRQAFPG